MAAAFELFETVPWTNTAAAATFTIDSTLDRVTFVFYPRDLSALADFWLSIGTATGTPQLRASLQSVAASGRESGTILASGNAYLDFTPTSNSNVWRSFGSSYTPTTRDPIALVVQLLSGTSCVINFRVSSSVQNTPFVWTYDSATQSGTDGTRSTGLCVFGVRSATTGNGCPATNSTQLWSSSGTNEYGNLFTHDYGTATLCGIAAIFRANSNASGVGRLYLGSAVSATTVVASTPTIDAAALAATSSYLPAYFPLETPTTINLGDSYRLTLAANNANQIGLPYWDVAAAADAGAWGSFGADCIGTNRAGANFTNQSTRIYAIRPVFSDLSAGGGSSGLLFRRNLRPLG